MERMLVVVFGNESRAYEGKKVLEKLDIDGYLTVYRHAMVMKNADSTITVSEGDDRGPFGLLVGTALGSLIGVLGGLAGIGIGGTIGLVAGGAADGLRQFDGGQELVDVPAGLGAAPPGELAAQPRPQVSEAAFEHVP
jgi:uncharacterized membrane protein